MPGSYVKTGQALVHLPGRHYANQWSHGIGPKDETSTFRRLRGKARSYTDKRKHRRSFGNDKLEHPYLTAGQASHRELLTGTAATVGTLAAVPSLFRTKKKSKEIVANDRKIRQLKQQQLVTKALIPSKVRASATNASWKKLGMSPKAAGKEAAVYGGLGALAGAGTVEQYNALFSHRIRQQKKEIKRRQGKLQPSMKRQ